MNNLKVIFVTLLVTLTFGFVPIVQATESGADPGQAESEAQKLISQDPYFRALMNLRLRKNQTKDFKKLMDKYALDRGKAIDKSKRSYHGDLKRVIRKAHSRISKKFVKNITKLLDENQMQAFPAFHEALDSKLKEHEGLEENVNQEQMINTSRG